MAAMCGSLPGKPSEVRLSENASIRRPGLLMKY